jgi:energy-coupling factor transport system ATP-binding protein
LKKQVFCNVAELVVNRLQFHYDDAHVLSDVTLQLTPGSFNLLVGPSGSGKSTLLKLMAGLYPQFSGGHLSGTLTLDGYPIGKILPYQRVQHIAYLFQNPAMQFTMQTPRDEIQFTLENLQIDPTLIPKRITNALAQVGMTAFADQNLLTLSGGEKQKIALATVLAMDSDILLLDEPFANVDPAARLILIDVLKAYQAQGKTILLADHDCHGYQSSIDQLYVMNQGHLHLATSQEQQAYLATPPTLPHVTPSSVNPPTAGLIHLDKVSLYNGERPLLTATSLHIPAHKRLLITGPNGVGKSTLLRALAKLIPYQGDIFYHDTELRKRQTRQHVRDIAIVFQNAEEQFITMTVAQEIQQAQQHARHPELWSDAVVTDTLQQLGLHTLKNQVVYQLSGGQQKKLQILVMLMMGTPVLLLDEPLAGLDSASQRTVLHLLAHVSQQQQQTVLMISHQLQHVTDWFDYHLHFEQQQLHYVGGTA